MNILANSRAYAALLVGLPRLGVTVAEGQTALQALEAHIATLTATPAAAAAPTEDQLAAGTVALLSANGITVAAGQTPAAAIAAFAAELEQTGNNLTTAQASLASTTTQLTAATARADLFATALSAKGIKITAADPKVGITAADIDAALEGRISTKAAELLGATGTPPVSSAPAATSGSEAAKLAAKVTAGGEIEAVAKIYKDRAARR